MILLKIILSKPKLKKIILLDGHRRLKVAFSRKLPWKALIMIPDQETRFGIEKMQMGKIKEVFSEHNNKAR